MKILDLVRKYNLPLGRILTGVFYTYCLTINNHLIAYGFFCFFFPFYNKEHTPDPTSIFSEVRVFSAPFLYFSFGFSFLTLFVITTFFERFLCYSLNIFQETIYIEIKNKSRSLGYVHFFPTSSGSYFDVLMTRYGSNGLNNNWMKQNKKNQKLSLGLGQKKKNHTSCIF